MGIETQSLRMPGKPVDASMELGPHLLPMGGVVLCVVWLAELSVGPSGDPPVAKDAIKGPHHD